MPPWAIRFVRMLRARGQLVEVQNTLQHRPVSSSTCVLPLPGSLDRRSDVRATDHDPGRAVRLLLLGSLRTDILYYKDNTEALRMAPPPPCMPSKRVKANWRSWPNLVADAVVEKHLATMLRLDVEYDVLPRESEILHLQFWASAYALLKERKAIYLETEGKNAGCWGDAPGLLRKRAR